MDTRYRPVPTRRGTYLVPWTVEGLTALVRDQGLAADDFVNCGDGHLKDLIRQLFLAGVADELATGDGRESRLTRLARDLLRRRERRRPQAAEPGNRAPFAPAWAIASP